MNTRLLYIIMAFVLCVTSCKSTIFDGGDYQYSYMLVNHLSVPVTYQASDKDGIYVDKIIHSGDTIVYHTGIVSTSAPTLDELHQPSLEDGYIGTIANLGKMILIVEGTNYIITKEQAESFIHCCNYHGVQDVSTPYKYNYYFIIDDEYMSTLK